MKKNIVITKELKKSVVNKYNKYRNMLYLCNFSYL